jgi:hypothetical protein
MRPIVRLSCRYSIRPPGCGKRIINKHDDPLVHTGGDDEPISVRVPVVRRTICSQPISEALHRAH